MLVFVIDEEEGFSIGPDIRVVVRKIRHGVNKAEIGVEAPRELEIIRDSAINKLPRNLGENEVK